MKPSSIVLLLVAVATPLTAATSDTALTREISLARELVEDTAIRYDDEGLRLGRERAERLAAAAEAAGDATAARDAHYLVMLASYAQMFTGNNDPATLRRLALEAVRHADRAAALDPTFGEAFTMAGAARFLAFLHAGRSREMIQASGEWHAKGQTIDPESTPARFFGALAKSMDPAGPARAEGVQAYGDLARRLDARRAAGDPVRPGFWDVEAHAWDAIVRLQQAQPNAAALRADLGKFLALRPDSAQVRELLRRVEHRSWVPASAVAGLAWKPLGSDPAGDGSTAGAPELRALELARGGDRVWFRLTYEAELPSSFGANLAIDRDGDPGGDPKWWGGGSSFRYDGLVTAWVVREGDGYFGIAAVTDAPGASAQRMMQLGTDVLLRVGDDEKTLMVGVPASVLGLAAGAKVLAAGGTNLLWNDNLTADGGDGIVIPAQ